MKTLHNQIAKRRAFLTEKLFAFERKGRYKDGLDALADIWPDHDKFPLIGQFEAEEAAEILLRCGSLIGFYGHTVQDKTAQEKSRDLIMTAQAHFLAWNDIEKAAECDNYLALSYWRTGELSDAQVWIDESLFRGLPASHHVRLMTQITQCLLNMPAKKYKATLKGLKALEKEFLACGDDGLLGDYFNHMGIALDNLGRKAEALDSYEYARFHHQRSGNNISLGTIENNLAWLYKAAGRFDKAYASIDNAARLFRAIKDKTREGFLLDTKATLLFEEQRYVEALTVVEKALSILKNGVNKDYLIDTLLTKAKILIFLDNFPDAVVSLIDAVNIARTQAGDDRADVLVREFEETLHAKKASLNETIEPFKPGSFELALPASLGNYSDYRGIRINSDRHECVGLTKGSLAIVAKTDVVPGDLAAVAEIETGEVTCGIFDTFAGIISIESEDGEPQLFDEVEVRVLGKIIGVCRDGNPEGGKMAVQALNV